MRIHDKVSTVFKGRVGETFESKEIIDLVVNAFPGTNRTSVIPSDYCYNITNKGIPFAYHQFESVGKALYRCLGLNYPYSGPITWKGEVVGMWEDGVFTLWKDPKELA